MNPRLLETFDHVPVSKHLGLKLVALDESTCTVVLDPKVELTQGYGVGIRSQVTFSLIRPDSGRAAPPPANEGKSHLTRYAPSVNRRLLDTFDHVPVSKHLGLKLVALDATTCTVVLDPKPELTQGYGVVQGGVISALADAAGVCCFLPPALDAANVTSIEFKINFLRPVLPENGRIEARSRVVQRGQKVGLAEVEVAQAGRLVAKGLFTYLLY